MMTINLISMGTPFFYIYYFKEWIESSDDVGIHGKRSHNSCLFALAKDSGPGFEKPTQLAMYKPVTIP